MPATLSDIASGLREGGSAERLTRDMLARADDPAGQGACVFVRRCDDEAIAAALHADERLREGRPRSPLDGIPIAIKANMDVAGEPTTSGAPIAGMISPAAEDAAVVARLRAAGAVVTGTTNMTQFALSCLGINPHHGTPLSPWRRAEGRIAGGSSSGAAAAVADRMSVAAIGTDTGGSVRVPAAFCGLVGFKPSQYRIDRAGIFPLSPSLDSVGVIAPTVACCRAIDAVLAGAEDDRAEIRRRPVLGVPSALLLDGLEEPVAEAFSAALVRLAAAGVKIVDVACPIADDLTAIGALGGFSPVEGERRHRDLFARVADRCDPDVMARFAAARDVGYHARNAMRRHRAAIVRWSTRLTVDALFHPTSAIVPPRLAHLSDATARARANAAIYRNAGIANLADGCAISIPLMSADGTPVGGTLMAARGHDARLLALAAELEPVLKGTMRDAAV